MFHFALHRAGITAHTAPHSSAASSMRISSRESRLEEQDLDFYEEADV